LSVTNYYDAMENEFLKRINQIVGEHQMNKIRGMIQDITNSSKVNVEFSQFLSQRKSKYVIPGKLEMSISLLTKAKWPSEIVEIDACKPPKDLGTVMEAFDDFYINSGTQGHGKKIEWLLSEGQVELTANYKTGKKNLTVTTPQYAVLVVLMERGGSELKLPLREITNFAGIDKSRFDNKN